MMPPGLPPGIGAGPGGPSAPSMADAGNGLLAPTPAQLTTGFVQTPGGQLGVLTIRTPSTTLTVMLEGKDLKTWAKLLGTMSANISGNGLVTGTPGPMGQIKPV